jgi:hypothetical protein
MKRAWLAVLVAIAAGIAVANGWGSGSTLVAYVTGSGTSSPTVWLANADGSGARLLGPGSRPLLAPNGSLVAASDTGAVVLYPASGGSPRRYFGGVDATAAAKAFSPDSRYLAVVLSSTDPASAAASGLAVIDTTTFASRIIVRGQTYGVSFAPGGSDRIAYGWAASAALTARVDVHVVGATGSGAAQITEDGRSLNPVWGRAGIAFDHERLRADAEPAYQVWLMRSDGSARRRLTSLAIPPLREGLVPVGFSDRGSRLLAEYEGQNTGEAWVLTLSSGRATPLGSELSAGALSHDGASVLVDRGGFLNPPDHGIVESLPVAGGPPRVLAAHGSEPSWNA